MKSLSAISIPAILCIIIFLGAETTGQNASTCREAATCPGKDPEAFAAADTCKTGDPFQATLGDKISMARNYLETGFIDSASNVINSFPAPGSSDPEASVFEAEVSLLKGVLELKRGNPALARGFLFRSLNLQIEKNQGLDTNCCYLLNKIGNYYFFCSNLDSANHYYRLSLQLAEMKKDSISLEKASSLQNIGIIYSMEGRFVDAEKYLLRALKCKKQLVKTENIFVAKTHKNLALFYLDISKMDLAKYHFDKAINIFSELSLENSVELGHLYDLFGNYYNYHNDYKEAMRNYLKASAIYEKQNNTKPELITSINHNIGLVNYLMGDYGNALYYYNLCLEDRYFSGKTLLFRNLANLYNKFNYNAKAREYYEKAIESALSQGSGRKVELVKCYRYYGNFLIENSEPEQGIVLLEKAEELARHHYGAKNRDLAYILNDIGAYYDNAGLIDSAILYYRKACDSYQLSDEYGLERIRSRLLHDPLLIRFQEMYARSLFRKYQLENDPEWLWESYQQYKECVQYIDYLGLNIPSTESSLKIREATYVVYNQYIDVLYQLYENTGSIEYKYEIFRAIEKNKAVIFRFHLQQEAANIYGNVPKELTDREKELKSSINSYENLIYREKEKNKQDREKIELWENEMFILMQEQDELVRYLDNNFNQYFNIKYNTGVLLPSEASHHLDRDEALVNYQVSDSVIYIAALNSDTFVVHRSECPGLDELIDRYTETNSFEYLRTIDWEKRKEILRLYSELYNVLLKPVEQITKRKNLVIIPDGKLSLLAFGSLIKYHEPRKDNGYNLKFVIHDHAVRYAPSATILFNHLEKQEPEGAPSVLAFAPAYSGNSKPGEPLRAGSFKPIPGAQKEVKSISSHFNTKTFTDSEASETNFKIQAKGYDILHFAMHASIDDHDPMYSRLIFDNADDTLNDGYLNTYEIYNLDLDGKLVVLSSCKSGLGKLSQGEGILNLSRAFQFAGIPSTAATLWNIEDISGSEIMNRFYYYLSRGYKKDEALRKSKMDFIKNAEPFETLPFFWSAYIIIGDNSPVVKSNDLYTIIVKLLFGLVNIYLIIAIYSYLRNRKPYHYKKP